MNYLFRKCWVSLISDREKRTTQYVKKDYYMPRESMNCQKMGKHSVFLKAKDDILKCPLRKHIQFTVREEGRKQKIFTFKKFLEVITQTN